MKRAWLWRAALSDHVDPPGFQGVGGSDLNFAADKVVFHGACQQRVALFMHLFVDLGAFDGDPIIAVLPNRHMHESAFGLFILNDVGMGKAFLICRRLVCLHDFDESVTIFGLDNEFSDMHECLGHGFPFLWVLCVGHFSGNLLHGRRVVRVP